MSTVLFVESTYSVAELAQTVARALTRAFSTEVWVEGEIRDLRRSRDGHVYFTLADPDDPGAVLPVSLFATDRQAVNRVLVRSGAMRMTDGVHVRIRGQVGYLAQRSVVRVRMTWIDTEYTLGRLAAERRELLEKLGASGLLERNARLALPPLPFRIGLITSIGSAAHADFLSELGRSGHGFEVGVVHARVQGPEAPGDVAAALGLMAEWQPDVVALVRGGGAQTDLAAFDTESVANAIATSSFPVFTGIGHEIDTTVADRVASRAFKTPTACAGGIIDLVRAFAERVRIDRERLHRAVETGLRTAEAALRRHGIDLRRSATDAADGGIRRLEMSVIRLVAASRRRYAAADDAMTNHRRRIALEARRRLTEGERRLDGLEAIARAHDPARMLSRGWTLTHDSDGRLVRAPEAVGGGDALITTTDGGVIHSRVATRERDDQNAAP